jgi:hypothetical protein
MFSDNDHTEQKYQTLLCVETSSFGFVGPRVLTLSGVVCIIYMEKTFHS